MKKLVLAKGKYSNGCVYLDDKEKYSHLEGETVEVQIYKKNNRRSNEHNAYYWSYIVPIIRNGLKDLGTKLSLSETDMWLKEFMSSITNEQTHSFLKEKFATNEIINPITGEVIKWTSSTRVLDKDEFQEYIDDVIQFANEILNIKIEQ